MTKIMDPQPGESVYDPTCGSGGLLLNCALHLKVRAKNIVLLNCTDKKLTSLPLP